MTVTVTQVLKDALALTPVDRAAIIEKLFQSFDLLGDRHVDQAWSAEVEARLDAYDQGQINASSAAEVFTRINQR